jgi:SHS2 domain-containing protein
VTTVPYRFRDDIATADVAFDAWGESREAMFASAADALLRTQVESPGAVSRVSEIAISEEAGELDLLLLAFLQDFIFHKDARRLLLHAESVRIEEADGAYRVTATARGEAIDPARHRLLVDVKAVTLHRLRAAFEDGAWRATVVLDV